MRIKSPGRFAQLPDILRHMADEDSIVDRSNCYCVIGAGPAGLLAARSLKHAGIPYEQFDKNDDVGGIWDPSLPDYPGELSAEAMHSDRLPS